MAYIEGSDGSVWPQTKGCRDKTPPLRDIAGKIPGAIYFAQRSKNWDNGGVAFYDPTVTNSEVLVRLYLVTVDQFNDIFLQENGLDDGDITEIVARLAENSSKVYGDGWYRETLRLKDVEGHPALTFTTPLRSKEHARVSPSQRYRETILSGLKESHMLPDSILSDYLKMMLTGE